MIPSKMRETRKLRTMKLSRNLERSYKSSKCRECAVVVTRMDFVKILGKFTKVKIQYESSAPKKEKRIPLSALSSKPRLKTQENGVVSTPKSSVRVHRSAYNEHPAKDLISTKSKPKVSQNGTSLTSNVLKESNIIKKSKPTVNFTNNDKPMEHIKQYGIIFIDPETSKNDFKSKITLLDLLPQIESDILPSDDWVIDYFPKNEEPREDKVYDRIAAELEDLMYNEKTKPENKTDMNETKIDEFPTIMDILNDNITANTKHDDQSSVEVKQNLESSDVEAMLLGETKEINKPEETAAAIVEHVPMEVDSPDGKSPNPEVVVQPITEDITDNITCPQSPSILDETLQKGIEEHLPPETQISDSGTITPKVEECDDSDMIKLTNDELSTTGVIPTVIETPQETKINKIVLPKSGVEELVFKKTKDGECYKSVTCPKSLKYNVVLEGKSVEFLGAPKFISSLEDLRVLLQIVNETELKHLYVLH